MDNLFSVNARGIMRKSKDFREVIMYLYHGSDTQVNEIDFNKCREIADFGKGFYLTKNREQAVKWAKRKSLEHMGSMYNSEIKGVVTVFEFNTAAFYDSRLKCRRFHGISTPWTSFVNNNIKSNKSADSNHNLDLKYDLLSGPAATLDIYVLTTQYENGQIDKRAYKAALKTLTICNQYSFHTPTSIEYLKLKTHKYYEVSRKEFDTFNNTNNYYVITNYTFNKSKGINQVKLPVKTINKENAEENSRDIITPD